MAPSMEGEYKRSYYGKKITVFFLSCSNKENKSQLHFAWSSKEHQWEVYSWGMYNICPCITCGQTLLQAQNHWFIALGCLALQKIRNSFYCSTKTLKTWCHSFIHSPFSSLIRVIKHMRFFTQKCVSKFRNIILISYITTSFWEADSCVSLCSLWFDG